MSTLFKRIFGILLLGAGLTACGGSGEQVVHHWDVRDDVGPNQFIIDHNSCLRDADVWPFDVSLSEALDFISPGPHDPKHRLDPKATRTWASFIPYRGAQAVYVNDKNSASTIDDDDYEACMESKGYVRAFKTEVRENLINDRRMGYRADDY
jgi:hypothetical protein